MNNQNRGSRQSLGIFITGGSKGLGYALAREFLLHGDRVIISGRNQEQLDRSIESLKTEINGCEIYGLCRDVSSQDDLGLFRSFIVTRLGQVDRWINNAGTAGLNKAPLWHLDPVDMLETCTTNLYGSMLMSRLAVDIMSHQPSENAFLYHIFNMGFSSTGARFSRSNIPHKTSKLGVAAVTRFLGQELHQQGIKSIGVHELSPGLVKTDLLLRGTSREMRDFLDIIAEAPEKVAEKLVPRIRATHGRKSRIRYRSIPGMALHALIKLAMKKAKPLQEKLSFNLKEKGRKE